MRYCYGVGSNFITGAPPESEDLITLRLCMKPKYNDPNCAISKQGFTRSDLPDSIRNETSICMRMTKQRQFLEAQNFHHKLQILLEAIIGCKTSYETQRTWKHFSLYYDGRFDDPLFIAHGFNQLQRACCIQNSARITGKNLATLRSLGILVNSEEFRRQLIWARDHPHSQEAKSLNAKVS